MVMGCGDRILDLVAASAFFMLCTGSGFGCGSILDPIAVAVAGSRQFGLLDHSALTDGALCALGLAGLGAGGCLSGQLFLNVISTVDLVAALALVPVAGAVGLPLLAEGAGSLVSASTAGTFVPVAVLIVSPLSGELTDMLFFHYEGALLHSSVISIFGVGDGQVIQDNCPTSEGERLEENADVAVILTDDVGGSNGGVHPVSGGGICVGRIGNQFAEYHLQLLPLDAVLGDVDLNLFGGVAEAVNAQQVQSEGADSFFGRAIVCAPIRVIPGPCTLR